LTDACPRGYEALAAPLDWVLWQQPSLQIRQPDVVVVVADESSRIMSAPLLVVEVLSPDSVERDLFIKRAEYGRAGLRHYWVVDPETPAIIVFRAVGAGPLTEHARATADQFLAIDEPFSIARSPSELIAPPV